MDQEKIIDLTGPHDGIGHDETSDVPTSVAAVAVNAVINNSTKTYNDNNNLDVFDYLADSEQNDNTFTESIGDMTALSLWNTNDNVVVTNPNQLSKHTTHPTTTTTTLTTKIRFIPNKIIPKQHTIINSTDILPCEPTLKQSCTSNGSRQNTTPNQHAHKKPGNIHSTVNNNISKQDDRSRKRMRDNNGIHNEHNKKNHSTIVVHNSNDVRERPPTQYDQRSNSRSSHVDHNFVHNENAARRRKHEFHHPDRPPYPPNGQHFERRRTNLQEQERVHFEHMQRQQEENARSIAVEKRENEVVAKEKKLMKAQAEWEEQKALIEEEIDIVRRLLKMDRDAHEKRCASQSSELERRRTEFEQEMHTRKAAMEKQFSDLQVKFKRDQEQVEEDFQTRQKELVAREANLTRQQSELDVRLYNCAAQEKIIAEFHVLRQSKEDEFESQRESFRKQQVVLSRQHEQLQLEKVSHQEDVELWSSNTDKERANLNQRIVDFNTYMHVKTTEMNARQEEQMKRQSELDTRANAQRRRHIQLNAMKKQIDDTKSEPTKGNAATSNKHGSKKANTEPLFDLRSGKPIDYILIDSDDDDTVKNAGSNRQGKKDHGKAAPSNVQTKSENIRNDIPQRRDTTNQKFDSDGHYNYSFTQESAFEMQERLFREAAERMRSRPTAEVATNKNVTATITTPMFDIAIRYPDHWKWKDPYYILGLPHNASVQLIKTQYRRLARTYHPDKSSDPNTSTKFHSISSAYHKLAENFG